MKAFKLLSLVTLFLILASCEEQSKKKESSNNSESISVSDPSYIEIKDQLRDDGRLVDLEGPVNFRDLGGLPTNEGKTIKRGMLFRSDKLSLLTSRDFEVLDSLNIKNIVDFRTKGEVEKEPYSVPSSMNYLNLPIGDDSWSQGDFMGQVAQMDIDEFEQLMIGLYKSMPVEFPDQYRLFFDTLLETEQPLVFHCTAGKDRTGVASALLLNLLGVDWDTIKAEYELSSDYREEENLKMTKQLSGYGISEEKTMMMMSVKANYLDSIFGAISDRYGSLDSYYTEVLNLNTQEISRLRSRLLD